MPASTSTALALHGGTPIRSNDRPWPAWPVFDDRERKALNAVLESGNWWYGERVAEFEAAYAAFQDAKYCVTCNSGTTAAEICMQALGIGPGDEVLVPPFTFIATASSVRRVGAKPVFVDVGANWNLDPERIDGAVTERTKGIMPVHFGSCVADMDRINELACKHELSVIEDACHSWGSKWKGKGTGALGFGGVFSFQMSKNLTAGEGGAILTDDEGFADLCRSISNCGRAKTGPWYGHPNIGTNARMTEFQAALLSAQLSRLEDQTLRREANGAMLNEALSGIEGLTPQPGDERMSRRAYHLYGLRIDADRFGCSRAEFVEAAKAEGLPIGPGYPLPLYEQEAFKNDPVYRYDDFACPVTEDLCYHSAMWMSHSLLLGTPEDMQDIVRIIEKIKDNAAALRGRTQEA